MTIAHLTSVHPPFDTRIFHKECRTLVETGYNVALVAPHERHEVVEGVEVIPVPVYRRRWSRMTKGAHSVYRVARELKADLYHFHDPELLPVGVLLKRLTGAPVVYDAHENYAMQLGSRGWMPELLKPVVPPIVGKVESLAVRTLDAVVCATEGIASIFPAVRTITINNYPLLDLSNQSLPVASYRADNKQVIFTGGWANHRGAYQLVAAMGHVKSEGIRLNIFGPCHDPFVSEMAKELPGYKYVDYPGIVPYKQLYEHMRTSAIGLVCYQPGFDHENSQPNKLFEYMSAGIPVIASYFPGWCEVVEGNFCGLTVDPSNPTEIAQAIDKLILNPKMRQEMGNNGRNAVLSNYNWKPEGKKLVELYRDLLN